MPENYLLIEAVNGENALECVDAGEAQKSGAGAYVKKSYLLGKIGLAVKNELNSC